MNDYIDELMNDYIDNSLSTEKINELNKILEKNENELKKLKALRFVDEVLKNLEVYSAPEDITEKVMKLISEKSNAIKRSVNKFMVSVFSFLTFVLFAICLVVLWIVVKESSSINLSNELNDFLKKGISFVNNHMNNNLFLIITSSMTLIIISALYFIIESHKEFKNKLKDIS
ncbi:MAG: hypothetical protein WHS65_12615 [Melioribacteraceae bacterium]